MSASSTSVFHCSSEHEQASGSAGAGGHKDGVPSEDLSLQCMPYKDRVWADQVSADRWQITDTESHRRCELVCTEAAIEVAEDGLDCLVIQLKDGEEEAEFTKYEDLFDTDVMINPISGNRYLHSRGAPRHLLHANLEISDSCYHVCCLGIPVRLGLGATIDLQAFAMKRKRVAGLNVYVGMASFYKAMGMTSYKKSASKWVERRREQWHELFGGYVPAKDHVILSRHGNMSTERAAKLPFRLRCLPQVSIDTATFLGSTCVWVSARQCNGGMNAGREKENIAAVYQTLLSVAATSVTSSVFVVYLSPAWKCQWPRPCPWVAASGPCCQVEFFGGADAGIGFKFDEHAQDVLIGSFKAFLAERCKLEQGRARLDAVLAGVYEKMEFKGVWAQLIVLLACGLENFWTKMHKSKKVEDMDTKMKFSIETGGVSAGAADMNETLWQYVEKCRIHSMKHSPVITFGTDKAVPASGAVQNSIIGFPNNVLMICCPQAHPHHAHVQIFW